MLSSRGLARRLIQDRICTSNKTKSFLEPTCLKCKKNSSPSSLWTSPSVAPKVAWNQGSSDWNRVMSVAKKVVGYSASNVTIRCLLSEEISSVCLHVGKLFDTKHPLLDTAKRLSYNEKSVIQTRGHIVLLIAKAAGHPPSLGRDTKFKASLYQRQRSLAEMTEMIYSAHLIHRGILNLQTSLLAQSKTAQNLHFGNKMSVLSGDFLLASVLKGLGELRNTKVVELMSTAIGDFMEGQFPFELEVTGEGSLSFKNWEDRTFMESSLQANACQSALALANHEEKYQNRAYDFGRNFALAWQPFSEIQPFLSSYIEPTNTVATFDLMSAPILLHFETTGDSLQNYTIEGKTQDGKPVFDYRKLHEVISTGVGLEKTKDMIKHYCNAALNVLDCFAPSDSVNALSNIVYAVRNGQLVDESDDSRVFLSNTSCI